MYTVAGTYTLRVEVPCWRRAAIEAVTTDASVATWREADLEPVDGPTHVSLEVEAACEADARCAVVAALQGVLDVGVIGPVAVRWGGFD
jgi:hypothetical protein